MTDVHVYQNEEGTFDGSFKGRSFVQTVTLTQDELDTLKERIVKADDDSVIIE